MNEPETLYDRLRFRIKNNPVLASLMVLGAIIVALSAFTDAAKNLSGLFVKDKRPDINGVWAVEITYPERNVSYVEKFYIEGTGDEVHGEASYFQKQQVIVEGKLTGDRIEFKTRTKEYSPDWSNDEMKLATHQYSGRVLGDRIELVMETYGGYSTSPPIKFTASRVSDETD